MFAFLLSFCITTALAAEFTLPGECPDVKLQENLDHTKVCIFIYLFKETIPVAYISIYIIWP